MIIAALITNSAVRCGIYDGGIKQTVTLSAGTERTSDEYALLLSASMAARGEAFAGAEGVIIGSVLPPLTGTLSEALKKLTGLEPVVVGAGVRTGLDIRIEQHTQLGADIVASTVAASEILKPPFAVIDFGDATTITAVNASGGLCGVVITAGIGASAHALSDAAELPLIELKAPEGILGKNTVWSMNSGLLYGFACMADGLIKRVSGELGADEINVAATGKYAPLVLELMETRAVYEPDLALTGLAKIFDNDRKRRKS